jgi:hypothetical protein
MSRGRHQGAGRDQKGGSTVKTYDEAYPLKDLIVMTTSGTIDLDRSKAALTGLAHDPLFLARYEVLLDWREVNCTMSETDIFELALHFTNLDTMLPTRKKIAILVSGAAAFDHAKFLELCSTNRGVMLHAFEDYEKASDWLNTTLPADSH